MLNNKRLLILGGHLNPAVSIAGAIMKKFKWNKVPYYLAAQYLGAFVAACGTYVVYYGEKYVFILFRENVIRECTIKNSYENNTAYKKIVFEIFQFTHYRLFRYTYILYYWIIIIYLLINLFRFIWSLSCYKWN